MKTPRPLKRSVSPFAFSAPAVEGPFQALHEIIQLHFPTPENIKPQLKSIEDMAFAPLFIEKNFNAPANDAPKLDELCQFLLLYRETLEQRGFANVLFDAMQQLFDRKTELFMIDHQDRAQCEKMGWSAEYRDLVLFSRERDALVGRYFAPLTETRPGLFSEFITRWMDTENPDRILHFLDFCSGSKNPTFEHYLLFTHPALARALNNKGHLRALYEKSRLLLSKLSSPTWENDIKQALSL